MDSSVGTCLQCSGGSSAHCEDATCATGFHTYNALTQTCSACSAISFDSAATGVQTCTACTGGTTTACTAATCASGTYGTYDACTQTCSLCANSAAMGATVSTCDTCSGTANTDCLTATCAAGYHTYATTGDAPNTCSACETQGAGCDTDTASTCLTAGDGRDTTKLACTAAATGYYLVGSGATSVATACTSQGSTACTTDGTACVTVTTQNTATAATIV